LPEEERAAEEEAVCYFAVVPRGLEGLPEIKADSRVLVFEGGVYGGDFFEHVHVVLVEFADPAEILYCLYTLVSGH